MAGLNAEPVYEVVTNPITDDIPIRWLVPAVCYIGYIGSSLEYIRLSYSGSRSNDEFRTSYCQSAKYTFRSCGTVWNIYNLPGCIGTELHTRPWIYYSKAASIGIIGERTGQQPFILPQSWRLICWDRLQ